MQAAKGAVLQSLFLRSPCIHHEELFDPNMPISEVEKALQEQTFDDWKQSDVYEIEYHDRESIEDAIAYLRRRYRSTTMAT